MVNKCAIIIFFVCFLVLFPRDSLQQMRKNIKNAYTTENEDDKSTPYQEGTHWKSVTIIVLGVLILGAICYGSNCLFICQMTLCKGSERHYTKMDLTSHV